MPVSITRRVGWVAVLTAAIVLATFLIAPLLQPAAAPEGSGFELVRPLFLSTASAADAEVAAFIDSEAGIAAYFQAPGALSLTTARPLFRTIEVETGSYILGSIPVPDYISESEDVHVYLHKDGWALAYYLAATPTANIIDWARFNGNTIVTKFDTVFQVLANELTFTLPSATYYHFHNPNSNYLLLVAETTQDDADDFTVFVNESLDTQERSWSLSSRGAISRYLLDGEKIAEVSFPYYPKWGDAEGTFTLQQLTENATHTVRLERSAWGDSLYAGLALVYRRP